jgi:hypothetical protein
MPSGFKKFRPCGGCDQPVAYYEGALNEHEGLRWHADCWESERLRREAQDTLRIDSPSASQAARIAALEAQVAELRKDNSALKKSIKRWEATVTVIAERR